MEIYLPDKEGKSEDEWLQKTFALITNILESNSNDIKILGQKKISNALFFWSMAGVFALGVGIFGMQIANISVSSKCSGNVNSKVSEVSARIEACCQYSELKLEWMEKYYAERIAELVERTDSIECRMRAIEAAKLTLRQNEQLRKEGLK